MSKRSVWIKFIFILTSLLFWECSHTDLEVYFTGQITYKYSYKSAHLNIDSLAHLKPEIGVFRYDLENYQSQFIGGDTTTYYYLSSANKAAWINDEGIYECENYGVPTDSIIAFKIYNTNEKIQDHDVDVLEFQSKHFWTRYYVSKELKLSPKVYEDHLAYNMSFVGKETNGGLILGVEHRFKDYTMIGRIVALNQSDNEFNAIQLDEYPACMDF